MVRTALETSPLSATVHLSICPFHLLNAHGIISLLLVVFVAAYPLDLLSIMSCLSAPPDNEVLTGFMPTLPYVGH